MGFTLEARKTPLEAPGYEIVGELSVFKIFDKAKVKDDEQAMTQAFEPGRHFSQSM